MAGFMGELLPGRSRTYDDEAEAELIGKVLHSRLAAATQWGVRGMAAHTGISKSSVARYLKLFGLQPHRSKSFKLSTDPFFVEESPRCCRAVPQSVGQSAGPLRA